MFALHHSKASKFIQPGASKLHINISNKVDSNLTPGLKIEQEIKLQ